MTGRDFSSGPSGMNLWRGALIALALIALAGCATALEADDFHFRDVDRIVAVGDIQGNWDGYIATLEAANLIDDRNRWIGGDARADGHEDEQGIEGILQRAPEPHAGDDSGQTEGQREAVLDDQNDRRHYPRQHQDPQPEHRNNEATGISESVELSGRGEHGLDDLVGGLGR